MYRVDNCFLQEYTIVKIQSEVPSWNTIGSVTAHTHTLASGATLAPEDLHVYIEAGESDRA